MTGRSFVLAVVVVVALTTSQAIEAQTASSGHTDTVRSIATAIAQKNTDREVTIAGRVLVSAGKLQSSAFDVAVEDGTGGIRLFSRSPQADVHEGDSVVATGRIQRYRGNIELATSRVTIVNAPRRVPPLSRILP